MKKTNYSLFILSLLIHTLSIQIVAIQSVRASADDGPFLRSCALKEEALLTRDFDYNPCNDFLPTGRDALLSNRFISLSEISESNISVDECLQDKKNIQLESKDDAIKLSKDFEDFLKEGVPVHLGDQWVTDDVLQYFQNARVLYLQYCDNITGIGFKYLQNLNKLALVRCTGIENQNFKHLQHIQAIDLTATTSINDQGLSHLKALQVLNLSHCPLFTGDILFELKALKAINLSFCTQIKDPHLQALEGITYVDLSSCNGFSNHSLQHLSKAKWINLELCTQVDDLGIKHLEAAEYLNIARCENVLYLPHLYLNHLKVLDTSKWWENNINEHGRSDPFGHVHIKPKRVTFLLNNQNVLRGKQKKQL